jgi:hypothetical protein
MINIITAHIIIPHTKVLFGSEMMEFGNYPSSNNLISNIPDRTFDNSNLRFLPYISISTESSSRELA